MKPLAMFVRLGVAGLYLAALVAAGALTNGQPPLISRPLAAISTNQGFAPFSSAPIVYLHGKTEHPLRLKPGVYQTRPYAIILIVPGSEHDDCCVNSGINGNSRMPNAKPDVQAVPKTFSQ
jgi:hypothetical protein